VNSKIKCKECEGKDFVELVRGYKGNPTIYLKCTQCGRIFRKPEENIES